MSFQLVGQSLSALVSTSLQNVSTCGSCHSLTETVNFTSLSFFRLIGSFHYLFSCFCFFSFLLLILGSKFRLQKLYHEKSLFIITQTALFVKQFYLFYSHSFIFLSTFFLFYLFFVITNLFLQVK